MSNFWNSQQPPTQQAGGNPSDSPRSGSLLRDYRQQQPQAPNQYSPVSPPPPSMQARDPYGPPPMQQRGQAGGPYGAGQAQGQGGFVANGVNMVKQWSGKFAAARRVGYEPPPPPMVLYRPSPQVPMPVQAKTRPWKRSRALRVSHQMRQRRQRWSQGGPNQKNVGIGVLIAFALLVVVLVSSTSAYAYSYYQQQAPGVQNLAAAQIAQTSRIYDRNGVLLYEAYDQGVGGGRRTYVQYKDIPQVMIDAMTAAEDPTFWTNTGIDPQGITRAAFQYASSGHVQSGGSTITQQLIKNLTGNAQDTLNRKVAEATLAIGMTQQYPKWKILEMYLNVAPFGSQDLGVEAATEEYFNLQRQCTTDFTKGVFTCIPAITQLGYDLATKKSNPLLALARASLLAGMPQSPVSYDPTLGKYNRGLALGRQDYVLNQMMKEGISVQGLGPITPTMITQAEALTAKMTFTSYQHTILAPHFVNWVIPQIEDALGGGAQGVTAFLNGGFNIRTTIDYKIEQYVEASVNRHLFQPEYQPFLGDYGPLNVVHNVNDAAVLAMNVKTGEIIAMDGSSNYYSTNPTIDGQFNVVTDGYGRQPGSTFKIFDYITAFEMGFYPGIVLPDVQTYFPNGGGTNIANAYLPYDYMHTFSNTMSTIRSATANSRNVPAVKAVMFAGVDNVINTARRLGVTAIDTETAAYNKNHKSSLTPLQVFGPSLALGTADIPLIQMVGAYQTLANQGVRVPPHSVLDIWDNYGHQLYHYDTTHPNGTAVVTPQLAYMMTSILADEPARAPEFGSDHVLSFWDMDPTRQAWQVAAKTGTTDNFVDNVTIGYTPDVVVGVWSGNADNSSMINSIGLTGAAPIWHSVMENLVGQCNFDSTTSAAPDQIPCNDMQDVKALHFTNQQFTVPQGIVQASTNTYNGLMGSGNFDWMLQGEQPQQSGVAAIIACQPATNGQPTTCTPGNGGTASNGNGNGNANGHGVGRQGG